MNGNEFINENNIEPQTWLLITKINIYTYTYKYTCLCVRRGKQSYTKRKILQIIISNKVV